MIIVTSNIRILTMILDQLVVARFNGKITKSWTTDQGKFLFALAEHFSITPTISYHYFLPLFTATINIQHSTKKSLTIETILNSSRNPRIPSEILW